MKENKELERSDLVVEWDLELDDEGKTITAKLETWFDVDKKFDLRTKEDDGTWLNMYANYNPYEETLTVECIVSSDTKEDSFLYTPTEAERRLIIEMIAETAQQKYHQTPKEFCEAIVKPGPEEAGYKINPLPKAEWRYLYSQHPLAMEACGCIGHVRGYFSQPGGHTTFTHWDDHCPNLKTDAFRAEWEKVFGTIVQEGGIMDNQKALQRFCLRYYVARLDDNANEYGFRLDTEKHSYLMRLSPKAGFYSYIYCYDRAMLERHSKAAEKGICFRDFSGKTRLRVDDGDSIRLSLTPAKQELFYCRYVNDNFAELSGKLYPLEAFAYQMESGQLNHVVPIRASLPEQCYSTLTSTGEIIILKRGESGFYATDIPYSDKEEAKAIAAEYNQKLGVTKAQEEAMKAGSIFGFHVPAADPRNYDADGNLIHKKKREGREER